MQLFGGVPAPLPPLLKSAFVSLGSRAWEAGRAPAPTGLPRRGRGSGRAGSACPRGGGPAARGVAGAGAPPTGFPGKRVAGPRRQGLRAAAGGGGGDVGQGRPGPREAGRSRWPRAREAGRPHAVPGPQPPRAGGRGTEPPERPGPAWPSRWPGGRPAAPPRSPTRHRKIRNGLLSPHTGSRGIPPRARRPARPPFPAGPARPLPLPAPGHVLPSPPRPFCGAFSGGGRPGSSGAERRRVLGRLSASPQPTVTASRPGLGPGASRRLRMSCKRTQLTDGETEAQRQGAAAEPYATHA